MFCLWTCKLQCFCNFFKIHGMWKKNWLFQWIKKLPLCECNFVHCALECNLKHKNSSLSNLYSIKAFLRYQRGSFQHIMWKRNFIIYLIIVIWTSTRYVMVVSSWISFIFAHFYELSFPPFLHLLKNWCMYISTKFTNQLCLLFKLQNVML